MKRIWNVKVLILLKMRMFLLFGPWIIRNSLLIWRFWVFLLREEEVIKIWRVGLVFFGRKLGFVEVVLVENGVKV
jgi:hypothetical protein